MIHLTVIVGSLRESSVNAAFARAAVACADAIDGVTMSIHDVAEVPMYDGDVEAEGLPPAVDELNETITASAGLVVFSPEYNGSFPAVTKNVIDWMSRPPKVWDGLPMALITVTPGGRAGLGLREHAVEVLERRPVQLFEPLGIGHSADKMTDGVVTDQATLDELTEYLRRFAAFCRAIQAGSIAAAG